MSCQKIHILDNDRHVVATACVEDHEGQFTGRVDFEALPAELRALFEEYESLVDDQVLSLLDPIEERIALIPLVAEFEDGRRAGVADLQVFPLAGTIAFRLNQPSTLRPGR